MVEIPLKDKYKVRWRGRYNSKHNDGQRKGPSKRKFGTQPAGPQERIMRLLPTGKIVMDWRNRDG